MANKEY